MHFTGRWAAVVWGCALPVLCVRSYPWALGSLRCQPAGRAANSRLLFPVLSLLVYPHLVGMALRSGHLRDNIGSRKTGGTVRLAVAVVYQSNTFPRFAKCGLAITQRKTMYSCARDLAFGPTPCVTHIPGRGPFFDYSGLFISIIQYNVRGFSLVVACGAKTIGILYEH